VCLSGVTAPYTWWSRAYLAGVRSGDIYALDAGMCIDVGDVL
jgi:hypothetical protein